MNLSDLRGLDFNNAGGWPDGVKYTACGLLFALLLFAGWWVSISERSDTLERKQKQEATLKKDFHDKQLKVVNLEGLKTQLSDMQDILHQLLRQLPSKTEMPELLVDISQAALSTGLETQLFEPGPETIKDGFYAEKPIKLRMLGTYHQFGAFISAVAALPRVVILTMHDVSLKPAQSGSGKGGQLMLDGTVKTYRYVDEDEAETAAPKKPGAPNAPAAKAGQ
jgi:type IV pilus assembly protein PilO